MTQKKQKVNYYEESKPQEWNPHPYQKKAIKFVLQHGAAGLFLDPGLGKTSITLAALKLLKKEGLHDKALIVAPLRVCYLVWPAEVRKWANFHHMKVVILHGDKKEDLLEEDADIYLINPEGLQWLLDPAHKRLKKLGVDTLVIDESSKFKKSNTQRFKVLKPFLPKFNRRIILTGTPAPNGLLDLFGQVYILDLGRALGPYITWYRKRFFLPSGYGGFSWKPKIDADKEITKLVKPLVLRLDAKDYLELPEIINNNLLIDLPSKARKIYDDLEEEMMAEVGGGEVVTAMSAAAASMKCRQVANGGLYRNNDVEEERRVASDAWLDIHMEKAEAVADLVEELNGQPLIVAYDFHHDLARLRKALGKNTPYIGGGVTGKRSQEIEKEWNKGNIPVLLAQPQSVAHGLNLQVMCQNVCIHSMMWDLEFYEQFIQRVARQGNPFTHVFVHHIIARDTVDMAMVYSLRRKDKVQGGFLDSLRTYVKSKISRK